MVSASESLSSGGGGGLRALRFQPVVLLIACSASQPRYLAYVRNTVKKIARKTRLEGVKGMKNIVGFARTPMLSPSQKLIGRQCSKRELEQMIDAFWQGSFRVGECLVDCNLQGPWRLWEDI